MPAPWPMRLKVKRNENVTPSFSKVTLSSRLTPILIWASSAVAASPILAAQPAVTFNPAMPVLLVCEGRGKYTTPIGPPNSTPIAFRVPSYPDKARRERWEGSAILEVQLDQNTGRAGTIGILSSTGHSVLDGEAMAVIREATFPRTWPPFFRVPVVFTLKRCNELPKAH